MITIKELRDLIEARLVKRFPDNRFFIKPFSRHLALSIEFWGIRREGVKFCSISAEKEQSSYIYKIEAFIDWLANEINTKNISRQLFTIMLHRKTASVDIYSRNDYTIGNAYAAHLANCSLN